MSYARAKHVFETQLDMFGLPTAPAGKSKRARAPRVLTPEQQKKRESNRRKEERRVFRKTRTELPIECVLLVVDSAARAGYCIGARGRYLESGEVDTKDDAQVAGVVQRAARHAELLQLPCVLMLEQAHGKNLTVAVALGARQRDWEKQWRLHCPSGDKAKIAKVYPPTWRRIVLGKEYCSAPRLDCQREERALAPQIVGEEHAAQLGPEECTACCMWLYASNALPVAAKIGKREVERAGVVQP